jgi:NADPH-dependent ferric siderophore reductase
MSSDFPFVLARVAVRSVDRVSPTFARITFAGEELTQLGTAGHVLDQRIKLIFPGASGTLPILASSTQWYQDWLAVPEEERGSMRTYSIRELVVDPDETTVVIDFVLHLDPGASGPASRWASAARPGDEVLMLGPRRGRRDGGGIEYHPGDARTVLLAGDETAAPAIARILEDVDREVRGIAFIEVPEHADELSIEAPDGVDVRWLPRSSGGHGTALIPAVLEYLGATSPVTIRDIDSDDPLWETPSYSRLGEELNPGGAAHPERYFWIAGESGVVTTLRRHLVTDLGIERSQVAFMGYWRKGVAMRG